MEKAEIELNRVLTYFGIWASNKSSPQFREIQGKMVQKLSDFRSQITQNIKLFARIKTVYESDSMESLNEEERRVVEAYYRDFVNRGAMLNETDKSRFATINQRLAELQTQFQSNVLADEEKYVLYLDQGQLGGLPETFINAAESAAKTKGETDKYAITNTRSSMDPFLTYSTDRKLREKVWKTYYNRGNNSDEFDNNQIIKEILQLRHERSQLLGFENYAQWRLKDLMAKNPANALDLMNKVWPAATSRVAEEVQDMQEIADAEGSDIEIEPWDYRYYAEKVRQAKYDLDSNEIKQYLNLDNLREAMFYVADRVFNLEFTPVESTQIPVFHNDVKVWEVTNKTTNRTVGLMVF